MKNGGMLGLVEVLGRCESSIRLRVRVESETRGLRC
jgi:hypothetical protein